MTTHLPYAERAAELARAILTASHDYQGYPLSPPPAEAFRREALPILTSMAQALGAAVEAITGGWRGGRVETSIADDGTALDTPRTIPIALAAAIEVLLVDDGARVEVLADTIAKLAIGIWRPSR